MALPPKRSASRHARSHPRHFLGLVILSLLSALPSLHAHRPFEITSTGRLQHGRLEFTVTVSLVMASFLLRDPAAPEVPPVNAENFELHREALLRLATDFYALSDGPAPLRPEKILLALNASGEPEFCFIYPLPAAGPLRIRISNLRAPALGSFNLVRVYDADETLLGLGLLGRVAPAEPELSIPISTSASAASNH